MECKKKKKKKKQKLKLSFQVAVKKIFTKKTEIKYLWQKVKPSKIELEEKKKVKKILTCLIFCK